MNKMKKRKKWTEENITYLQTAYLEGSSLKKIAAQLNRSVSAINKALSRHKLRTQNKIEYLNLSPHRLTHYSFQGKKYLIIRTRKKNTSKIKSFEIDHREWVSFPHVIGWLQQEGISVIKSATDVYYEVNGYPKSKEQILLIANLRREQKKLPIFFVKDLMN